MKQESRFSNNYDPSTLTNDGLRHLKRYREARDQFIIGKVCECCRSNENLHINHTWTFWSGKYLKIKIDFAITNLKMVGSFSDSEKLDLLTEAMEYQIQCYLSFKNCNVLCKDCHFKQHFVNPDQKLWQPINMIEGHHPLHKFLKKRLVLEVFTPK